MFRLQGRHIFLQTFSSVNIEDQSYLAWLNDYEVVKTINRVDYLVPVRLEDVRRYCEAVMISRTDIFLAIYLNNDSRFVGTVRVSGINWRAGTAEIGILVGDRTVWGQGVATDAIRTTTSYLFKAIGLRKINAGLMAANPAMLRVFTKLGFSKEGVQRLQDCYEDGYCDHIYLGCFKHEFCFNDSDMNKSS